MSVRILNGDCREVLRSLPDGSARCCVTSPPYFGLRDYGHDAQIGLEPTPDEYVAALVGVFREVRRVLADDGTMWLNLGDSYAGSWGSQGHRETPETISRNSIANHPKRASHTGKIRQAGLKPKDLIGIPWRVAFALQADGWWLRSAIVWAKPNPMPSSVRDRPTSSYETVFLLAKSERYFYDSDAVKEAAVSDHPSGNGYDRAERVSIGGRGQREPWDEIGGTRNARDVWTITPQPFAGAHFAVMPPELAERCIRAGSAPGDTILDPFGGAGTTGLVADRLGRSAVLVEANPEYAAMARRRIAGDAPLLTEVA